MSFRVIPMEMDLKSLPDLTNVRLRVVCQICREDCVYIAVPNCHQNKAKGSHNHIRCKNCTPENQAFCVFTNVIVDGVESVDA